MKIMQLIPNILTGGAERFVVDLSNELVQTHEVTLLTLYDEQEDDFFRGELAPDIKIKSLGKQIGFDRKIIPKLYRAIKKIAPDVIHNHLRSFNYLMPLIPFLNKTPIVHTVHSDAYQESPNSKIRRLRKQFFKQKTIMPVTISQESQNSFTLAYPRVENKLIENGRVYPEKSPSFKDVLAEVNDYNKDGKTKLFVHIGSIRAVKNQLMLVKAFNQLIYKDEANAHLLIIGGGRGKESQNIQQRLQQAEREHSHIHLLGEKSNATDYLYLADFFCLSSVFEGMPISLIEALATATIPVCTPVGGITEIVNELETSLLAKSVDTDDYYQALKRAYEMPEEKQQILKKRAKQLFDEKYSMKICGKKYEELYQNLIEKISRK